MLTKRFKQIQKALAELNDEAYYFDGFEEALVGYIQQFGRPIVACYDYDKCIKVLMRRDKMSEEDAMEFFEFNTIGCGLGDNTPAIIKSYE